MLGRVADFLKAEKVGGESTILGKKSAALVLATVIGMSLFIGLAFAAPGSDPITQLLNLVNGLVASVDAQRDNYVRIKYDIVSVSASNFIKLEVLPAVDGQTYKGHLTLTFDPISSGLTLFIDAFVTGVHYEESANQAEMQKNIDFACDKLTLFIINNDVVAHSFSLNAVIQYTNSTNGITLTQ